MSDFEEQPYSTIFASLKHPVRRKILRMLSEKPRTFSKMLDALGVSSSHLTYHLENLGELVSKMEDGRYKLSAFGEAAVATMSKVEETPKVAALKSSLPLPLKWKSLFLVLLVCLAFLAGVSYIQSQSLYRTTEEYEPLKELTELMKKGATLQSQYTLRYVNENYSSTTNRNCWYSVLYIPYDNSVLSLSLTINGISLPGYVPINVQKGDALAPSGNETPPVIWNLNTSISGKYLVPLASNGWYTVSIVGSIVQFHVANWGTSIIVPQVLPLFSGLDCEMCLSIIHEGNPSPFAVKS